MQFKKAPTYFKKKSYIPPENYNKNKNLEISPVIKKKNYKKVDFKPYSIADYRKIKENDLNYRPVRFLGPID